MRDDLTLRPLAKSLGYTESFNINDEQNKRFGNTNADCPMHAIQFIKGEKHIWFNTYNGLHWRCAELNGFPASFKNHRTYNTLEEALTKEA
jgi:hypothetical protein